MKQTNKGITLIALIITIVVMLILVGVVISTTVNSNIIGKAKGATGGWVTKEGEEANLAGVQVGDKTYNSFRDYVNANPSTLGGNGSSNVQVQLADGRKETLTKENFGQYLGMKVANYEGQGSVTIDGQTYTMSPDYRLYYVDFDNKFGDGAGTIYLKADFVPYSYELGYDTESVAEENIKLKNLNPALYREGVTNPSNPVINRITWLTNANNWADLADTDMSSNINYIVGAPSLEMMIDSYNTYYNLTGDTPDHSPITEGERRKLFYKYESNTYGYQVGPFDGAEYGFRTIDKSVDTELPIFDSSPKMYIENRYDTYRLTYFLASPAHHDYTNYHFCVRHEWEFFSILLANRGWRNGYLPACFSKTFNPIRIDKSIRVQESGQRDVVYVYRV